MEFVTAAANDHYETIKNRIKCDNPGREDQRHNKHQSIEIEFVLTASISLNVVYTYRIRRLGLNVICHKVKQVFVVHSLSLLQ